jgi:hypothetical protein
VVYSLHHLDHRDLDSLDQHQAHHYSVHHVDYYSLD